MAKEVKKGDSTYQKQLEKEILEIYNRTNKILVNRYDNNKTDIQLDYYNEKENIIGEIYAGMSKPKSGHIRKIMTDCLKLIYFEKQANKLFQKEIIVINRDLQNYLKESNSWHKNLIELYEINIVYIELSEATLQKLNEIRLSQTHKN